MGTFLLGSIVAALAPNFGVLMLARVIQAMGAGVLMPLMQFTLFTLFSKEHRGFAMGLAGLVIQFAPAIGPTVTGLIIDQASWRGTIYYNCRNCFSCLCFRLSFNLKLQMK